MTSRIRQAFAAWRRCPEAVRWLVARVILPIGNVKRLKGDNNAGEREVAKWQRLTPRDLGTKGTLQCCRCSCLEYKHHGRRRPVYADPRSCRRTSSRWEVRVDRRGEQADTVAAGPATRRKVLGTLDRERTTNKPGIGLVAAIHSDGCMVLARSIPHGVTTTYALQPTPTQGKGVAG